MYGNSDIISLKKSVKKGEATPETIVRTYFDRKTNPVRYHWLRVLFNYLVKVLYIVVNLVSFYGTNALLYGKFTQYGKSESWSLYIIHILKTLLSSSILLSFKISISHKKSPNRHFLTWLMWWMHYLHSIIYVKLVRYRTFWIERKFETKKGNKLRENAFWDKIFCSGYRVVKI